MKCLAVVLAFLSVIFYSNAEIVGTAILFRHGQRTPQVVFPSYGATPESKELGLGELTLTGNKQLYEYGADLRKRYLHLFPVSGFFRTNNMQVLSSPVPRCVRSLTSFMAGFFPPPAKDKTLPISWQSFAFAQDNDYRTVVVNTDSCPVYVRDAQVAQAEFAVTASAWMVQDKEVLDRVSAVLGVPLNSLGMLQAAFDLLQSNRFLDATMPQWLLDDLAHTIKKYTLGYYRTLLTNDLAKKVQAGNLYTEIQRNLVAIRDGSASAKNFLIYSGHDTSMSSLAKLLGVDAQLPEMVNYGDILALEVDRAKSGELTVQVLYSSAKKKTLLEMPGCGVSCPLANFLAMYDKYIVADFDALCAE